MKEVISDWLEEGFSNFDASLKRVKNENSSIPLIENEAGEIITPKPLFPVFLDSIELDSNVLVEYLEVIQSGLRVGKDKSYKISSDEKISLSKHSSLDTKYIDIEYERKNIFLSRTVLPLFEMPDTFISNWSPQYQNVLIKNNLYKNALELRNKFPYNFCEESTQVGYSELCEKQIATIPIICKDKKFVVTSYLMKKYYNRNEVYVKPPPKTFSQFIQSRTKFRDYNEFQTKLSEYPDILETLKNNLYVLEKALDYNSYERTIISFNSYNDPFKSLTIVQNADNTEKEYTQIFQGDIHLHLQFYFPILKHNYCVTCIECNPLNSSIFFCGYGVLPAEEMSYEHRGVVLCWNIHKCGYPEKIFEMEEVVTSIEISKTKPYHLAVGMRYGLIAVIDLRQPNNTLCLTNRYSNVRPTGTIRSVRWMTKKHSIDKEVEILLAISMDGIVTAWTLARTLEGYILKTIKRADTEMNDRKFLFLANSVAGVCMHVKPDEDIFMIGTIEGEVLQTNFNAPDDNIEIKSCHFGTVNDLKWSPLVKNVFMTCGTDRCLHIWELNKSNPSKTLIFSDNILCITLSTMKSTLFAAMTKSKIFIYDLDINLHKPIIELDSLGNSHYSFVTFCPKNNWIIVGHSDGVTSLYEITDIPDLGASKSGPLRSIFLPEC